MAEALNMTCAFVISIPLLATNEDLHTELLLYGIIGLTNRTDQQELLCATLRTGRVIFHLMMRECGVC
jgi:hypothetical protein